MEETVLICLPFAGAGPSFYAPWQALAPTGLRILPVQLPGREKRFAEPAYTSVAPAVDDAYAQVTAALGDGGPVALFGHSMGAVLAYELAHRIEQAAGPAGPRLESLVVSGSPGPWTARTDRAGGLPDEEFTARVKSFAGYAHPALEDPEMRELLLPALRADVRLHETYVPSSDRPLSVPVTSVRGRTDALVGPGDAAQWCRATTGVLTVAELDGGHMYLADQPAALLKLVAAGLRTARDG
ncbi:thioesterase II family protein [Streptomyces sp. NPDC079020]|uniref:thioesterase II family protein n=1 Tax=Streptomyces sp. NPDC079020 TaxID=3365722 RepID=UPI0037D9118F